MVNRYKEEVSKLILSESQNQKIKDLMMAEYLKQADKSIIKSNSIWSRYSKYIACAACLALIIATIGFTSATNGLFSAQNKSFSLYDSDNAFFESEDSDIDKSSYDYEDYDAYDEESEEDYPENSVVESDIEYEGDDDIVIESPVDNNELTASDSFYTDGQESKSAESDGSLEDTTTATGSQYAPENYDGEYFAEDYVFVPTADTTIEVQNLISADGLQMTYNELCNTLPDLYAKVGFVKFEITDILSDDEANAIAGDDEFSAEYTMYKASLVYDYLSYASASGEMYISAYGNELTQIEGYPTFAVGDTILALVDPEGSYVKIINQMVYQVHRVNGVDIAYHILYENIDPGDTNMGILDMESLVYTTTSNNQAIYTAKASVKELTRYIRRNFNKRGIQAADMTNYTSKADSPANDLSEDSDNITGDSVALEHTLDADKIVFKIRNIEMQPLSSDNDWSQFATYSYATTSSNGTQILRFGQNIVAFDDDKNITSITICESSQICPFTINGISAGESWTKVVAAIGADIAPQYEETVTFSVISNSEVYYNLTFTVKSGMVQSITID